MTKSAAAPELPPAEESVVRLPGRWAEQAFHEAISESGLRPDERPLKYFIRQCTNLCTSCGRSELFTETTLLLQHPKARIIRPISRFEWNLPIETVPGIHYEVPACTYCTGGTFEAPDLSHLPNPPAPSTTKTIQFPTSPKKKAPEKKTYTINDLL